MTTNVLAGGPGEFLTARQLSAEGSQADIGRALAVEAESAYSWRPVPADPRKAAARREWFSRHWPQHHERMRGAAAALGLDFEADDVFLDGLTGVPAGSGCTAVYVPPSATSDGHALLARNYDFFTSSAEELFAWLAGEPAPEPGPPMASRPYVLTTSPDDGPRTTVLTMNELDGCTEGVNEHGVGVALLIADIAAPNTPVPAGPQVGIGSVQLPRFVLDTCASAAEARRKLLGAKQYDLGAPLHYLIGDASGDAFVWERGAGGAEYVHDLGDGPLCVTNHLLHGNSDQVDTEETFATHERLRTVRARSREGVQSPDTLRKALAEVAAETGDFPLRTLWRTVFDLTDCTMTTSFYLGDFRYSDAVTTSACGGESKQD